MTATCSFAIPAVAANLLVLLFQFALVRWQTRGAR